MFEHLRPRIYNARRGLRWVWSPAGKAAKQMLAKLRYLMACLEDTNRIEALKLQIGEFLASGLSLLQLTTCIENWRKEHVPPEKTAGEREPAFAYTFA